MRPQHFMCVLASVTFVAGTSTHGLCEPAASGNAAAKSTEAMIEAAPRAAQIEPMVAPVKRTAPQVVSLPSKASAKRTAAKPAATSTSVKASLGNSRKPNIKTASKTPAKKTH